MRRWSVAAPEFFRQLPHGLPRTDGVLGFEDLFESVGLPSLKGATSTCSANFSCHCSRRRIGHRRFKLIGPRPRVPLKVRRYW